VSCVNSATAHLALLSIKAGYSERLYTGIWGYVCEYKKSVAVYRILRTLSGLSERTFCVSAVWI